MNNKKHFFLLWIFLGLVQANSSLAASSKEEIKGLLPEIKNTDEASDETNTKSVASELLISKSEEKATQMLLKIIEKNKGAENEAELHDRLAELYMRRSKSGRFFDLNRENSSAQKSLQLFPVPVKSGKEYVKKAVEVYDHLLKNFKNYRYTDTVLFENAFAYNQLNQTKRSLELYHTLIKNFPQSKFLPESLLAVGEIYYNEGKFKECLNEISQLENFKDSRVYLYGMYKAAWAHYNMKNSTESIAKLLAVSQAEGSVYSLRKEAMKDLILFTSDFYQANQMYPFFKKNATEEELTWVIVDLTNLYQSYSRYLDSNLLIEAYQKDAPLSSNAVNLEMALAENFEWLKKRPDVLTHLELAQKHCQVKSRWADKNSQEVYQESCHVKLKSFQAEMTKKWWEIWEKNKKHKEFNEWLISLLRIGTMNEDMAETDKKTRYLLSEILFQNEIYDEASAQYQLVADKSQDPQLRHDSYYSALYSFEKYIESPAFKNKMSKRDVQDRIYVLSQQYLTYAPQGAHNHQVRLKLATLFTEKKDYTAALGYLKEIKDSKDNELILKSQDLQMEIHNILKDYKSLKNYADSLIPSTADKERAKKLTQISREAEFNQILGSKDNEKMLIEYSEKNSTLQLGQEALWKVISENYKNKKMMTAAQLSEKYAAHYPNDEKSASALKEALAFYVQFGFFNKAIELSAKIKGESSKPDAQEKMADYQRLENRFQEAADTYSHCLEKTKPGSEDFQRLFDKLKLVAEKDSRVQLDHIYSNLIQKGIEPYLSRHQTQKAEALLQNGNVAGAFDAAKKIMSKSLPAEEKFGARLIQAQVLEKEFVSQSLKASPSKLSLVLAIKTEKFDKAQTSFNDALKMTQDPERQKTALAGVQRSFDHFIISMENIPLSDELSEQEKTALKKELEKLIQPLKDRRAENQERIAQMAGVKSSHNKDGAQALVLYQDMGALFQWPLLVPTDSNLNHLLEITEKTKFKEDSIRNQLNDAKNEKINLMQLALLALQDNKLEKAQYLLFRIQDPNQASANPFVSYLYGYTYQKDKKFDLAFKYFSNAYNAFEGVQEFNKISKIEEYNLLQIVKSFSSKDYSTVLKAFENLKKYPSNHIKLAPIFVDTFIGTGQTDKAIQYLKTAIKQEKDPVAAESLKERLFALQSQNARQISSETQK